MLKDEYASKILNRLGWTLPEIVALAKSAKPGEVEYASLRCKRGRVPDGTDLFASNEGIAEEIETSVVNPAQTDALICEIVVEPAGATVELILNVSAGKPILFTQEEVAKAVPGIWIARGMSMQARIQYCANSRASVRLMGWEVVKKR